MEDGYDGFDYLHLAEVQENAVWVVILADFNLVGFYLGQF